MSSLSTLDLQNNDIAQVPPQLGNVTQLRWDGAGKSFQLGRTLWSLSSIFLSLDIAVSGIRHFINAWHSVLFSQPRQKKVHRLFITLWKKTCIALLYVSGWFHERNLMFHVNIEEYGGGSGVGVGGCYNRHTARQKKQIPHCVVEKEPKRDNTVSSSFRTPISQFNIKITESLL